MDHLLKLLKSNSGLLGTPNVSLAQTGSESTSLTCHFHFYSTLWIIDSGASDHMTSFSNLFHTDNHCSSHEKIYIADDSYSHTAG